MQKISITVLLALVVFLGLMVLKPAHKSTPTLVTVNLPQLIQKYTRQLAQNENLNASSRQVKARGLSAHVTSIVNAMAKENNLIVLPHSAVIAGVKDMTKTIDQAIEQQKKQEKQKKKEKQEK